MPAERQRLRRQDAPPAGNGDAAATPGASTSTTDPVETSQPAQTTESTTEQPVETTSTTQPAESTSSTTTEEEPSTTEEPTTSSEPPEETTTSTSTSEQVEETTTSSEEPESTSSTSTTSEAESKTTITREETSNGSKITEVVTMTQTVPAASSADPTATSSGAPGTLDPSTDSTSNGGLDKGAKVAIGVVVPIVAIAIIAIAGLFWWKKRRARHVAEEERRKEVEDYSYNPNNDPTLPPVGMAMADNSYEMREDGSAGYRGWGTTTVAGSSGRKASTTMSGGVGGMGSAAYSDAAGSQGHPASEPRSGEPLVEGEILGAMGPSAANNRNGDVRRGPSNASSSYSAAQRSDNSDGMNMAYSDNGDYGTANPYVDNGYGRPSEMPGAPVIRDNPARRNTRIENPAHYPQQSAGISQNF